MFMGIEASRRIAETSMVLFLYRRLRHHNSNDITWMGLNTSRTGFISADVVVGGISLQRAISSLSRLKTIEAAARFSLQRSSTPVSQINPHSTLFVGLPPEGTLNLPSSPDQHTSLPTLFQPTATPLADFASQHTRARVNHYQAAHSLSSNFLCTLTASSQVIDQNTN
jgi:hypothetical protein